MKDEVDETTNSSIRSCSVNYSSNRSCHQAADTGRCQQVMDTGRCQQVTDTDSCEQATLMSCCCSIGSEAEAEPFYQQIESSPKRYLNIDLYAYMRWGCVGCDGRSSSGSRGSRQLSQGRHRSKHCPALYLSDVIIWALILSFLARGISASYIGSRTDGTFNYSSLEHRSSGHSNDMGGAPHNFSTSFRHKNRTDPMKNRTDPMKNEDPMKDEAMHSSPDKADLNQDPLSSPEVSKSDDGFAAAAGTKSDSKQSANIMVEPAHLTATEPHHDDSSGDEDNTSKIIGLVVPFVCVILLAVVLCVSWRLCRRYKLCRNEACLEKCSLFCNNCMSAPLVFQAAEQVKFQSQVSRTTTTSMAPILKHSRSSASPSSVSLSTAGVSRQQPQSSRTSNPRRSNDASRASRHSHASVQSGVSRHGSSGSSRHSTGYSPVGQKNLVHAVSV